MKRILRKSDVRLPPQFDHVTPEQAATLGEETRAEYERVKARPGGDLAGYARTLWALEHRAGEVRGLFYVDWIPTLDKLRTEKKDDAALGILLECVDAAERVARVIGREPAPGYTERAAVIYHRRKEYAAEIAIIERWEAACPPERRGPGATQERLAKRLARARDLAARS